MSLHSRFRTLPHIELFATLTVLALIYLLINFVLTPNSLSPLQQDDYAMLGTGFSDMRFWIERPLSSNLVFFMGQMGPGFSYFLVNFLTVLNAGMTVLFVARLCSLRFSVSVLVMMGVLSFSDISAFEHGKMLGLITNLSSNFFGILALLLLLVPFDEKRAAPVPWTKSNLLGLIAYAMSVFCKEDFLLPPLLLIAYQLLRDWQRPEPQRLQFLKTGLQTGIALAVLAALGMGFSFLVKNPFLAGLTGAVQGSGSYAVNLSLDSVFASLNKLTITYIPTQTALAVIAFIAGYWWLPQKRKEIALLVCIIFVLILPYALIPNRILPYRTFGWLPWLAATAGIMIQTVLDRQRNAITHLILHGLILISSVCLYFFLETPRQIVALWYQTGQAINHNMLQSLEQYRVQLAHQDKVGILGVEGLSPWSNTDAEYLRKKLGFPQHWIVFIEKSTIFNTIEVPQPDKRQVPEEKFKTLQFTTQLCAFPHLVILQFDQQGKATLTNTDSLCAHQPQ